MFTYCTTAYKDLRCWIFFIIHLTFNQVTIWQHVSCKTPFLIHQPGVNVKASYTVNYLETKSGEPGEDFYWLWLCPVNFTFYLLFTKKNLILLKWVFVLAVADIFISNNRENVLCCIITIFPYPQFCCVQHASFFNVFGDSVKKPVSIWENRLCKIWSR